MATMATSGIHSTLDIPTADDTMEISSDAGRADQDIDIDFMGSEHGDNDIDWMLQDAASEGGNVQATGDRQAHDDDLMYDDDADEITYVEESMQDDTPAHTEAHTEPADLDIDFDPNPATEETLYDATDDVEQQPEEIHDQPEEEALIDYDTGSNHEDQQLVNEQTANGFETADTVALREEVTVEGQDISVLEPEHGIEGQAEAPQDERDVVQPADQTPLATPASVVARHEEPEAQLEPLHQQTPGDQPSPTRDSASSRHSSPRAPHTDEQQADVGNTSPETVHVQQHLTSEQPLASLDASSADSANQTGANFDAVHPITVFYGGEHFPLFPASEDDDPNSYLLHDPLVASSTLVDFFHACRSVLDQDLNEDTELEIVVPRLGLTIHEDSIHCRDTSLAQIVEVYVELMHNDGVESPDPLLIKLNIKNRFSAQLTYLFKAAAEKKGLHHLVESYQDQTFEQEWDGNGAEGEEEQGEENVLQDDGTYAEESTLNKATTNEFTEEAANGPATEAPEETADHLEESTTTAPEPSHDATQQIETLLQDSNDQHTTDYEYEDEVQQEFAGDVEQGEGSSPGSSTVQGETQPQQPRGYTPSADEEEWLIDYSDEDDYDASSETIQVQPDTTEEPAVSAEDYDTAGVDQEAEEAYDNSGEHQTESYDDSAYDADTFNQEFEAYNEYGVDLEYHEETQEDGHDLEQAHQDWVASEDTRPHIEDAPAQSSGTFEVPDASEEDEDEITFNDDELTAGDEETQEAPVQEHSPNSPLGKRSREEDGDDVFDGSDQESKRLKAA